MTRDPLFAHARPAAAGCSRHRFGAVKRRMPTVATFVIALASSVVMALGA